MDMVHGPWNMVYAPQDIVYRILWFIYHVHVSPCTVAVEAVGAKRPRGMTGLASWAIGLGAFASKAARWLRGGKPLNDRGFRIIHKFSSQSFSACPNFLAKCFGKHNQLEGRQLPMPVLMLTSRAFLTQLSSQSWSFELDFATNIFEYLLNDWSKRDVQ